MTYYKIIIYYNKGGLLNHNMYKMSFQQCEDFNLPEWVSGLNWTKENWNKGKIIVSQDWNEIKAWCDTQWWEVITLICNSTKKQTYTILCYNVWDNNKCRKPSLKENCPLHAKTHPLI